MFGQLIHRDPLAMPVVETRDDPAHSTVERIESYPGATFRLGPRRPYVAGLATLDLDTWRP